MSRGPTGSHAKIGNVPGPKPDLTGKVIAITGGNAGIGREAAWKLARMGATVVITSRSAHKGEVALRYVRERGRSHSVQVMSLDLSSLASVQRFAAELQDRYDRLDVLVNNAGAVLSRFTTTADGFEATFGANHLGHFLLTHLLTDRLRASAPARVVNTASVVHRYGTMRWSDLEHRVGYNGSLAYNQSKLANVLFTMELARRLADHGVTANCHHPGAVRSGFGGADDTTGLERLLILLGKPFMIPARWGARPIVYLAASPEVVDTTACYWVGGYVPGVWRHRPSREARDPEAARRLWQVSASMLAEKLGPDAERWGAADLA